MVATVCKQEGVNEQFTDISSIVRSFMGLTEVILSGKRDDRSVCKPQTHWLHAPILSCKDNQVQIPKGTLSFFCCFFFKFWQSFTLGCDESRLSPSRLQREV